MTQKNNIMQLNDITHEILDSAYKVHSTLGPGLLESAYQSCLVYELRKKGLTVEVEKALPLVYEDMKLNRLRIDASTGSATEIDNDLLIGQKAKFHCHLECNERSV